MCSPGVQFQTHIEIFSYPPPFFFYSFPPLPYLFHPYYLPSAFIQYFSPFSPFLSFRYIHSTCAQLARSVPSFLSFPPIPIFSLLVPTSKSRHHFSFSCTLSLQILRNFLCYTPLILPVVSGFFDSYPSFLLVCVFVPFTQLYIHQSPFALNLSTSLLTYPFL
jgi:hypothetical protein